MSESERMSGIHDCGRDAAAYVLGALDPVEQEAFRRHLDECAMCRDEVEALVGVVQALPMAARQYPAPKRLRRRVMRAIRNESLRPGWRRASLAVERWSQPRAVLATVAAAAVVAAGILVGLELGTGAGTTRVIHARVTGIAGTAVLREVGSRGELIVRHLSPPPPGHVYEVWLSASHAAPAPAGVLFSVTARGSADLGLPESLRGISQVMVTPEPDGGSPAPTHTPVIVATLT